MTAKVRLKCCGPPLTLDEIEAFEREIGGRLPDDYKRFLLARNGGVAEPGVVFPWQGTMEKVSQFLQLLPTPDRGLRRCLAELRRLGIEGFLPVAATFGAEEVCLAFRGDIGAAFFPVYKYKSVFAGDLVPAGVEAMVPLAASFTEFLASLVEIREPYCRIRDLGKRGTPDDLAHYLDEGNSIDALGRGNSTIVCEAIKFDNLPMIRACIQRGASLSGTVQIAARTVATHLIEILVRAGADVNERDEFGDSPLQYVPGTALPGEEGARNRELRDLLINLGAVESASAASQDTEGSHVSDESVNLKQELLTKNACIYSNERRRLSVSLLRRVQGVSDVSSDGGFFRQPTCLKMRIDDEPLQLNANFDRQSIKQHVAGMHGWVDRIHEVSPLMNIEVFHAFLDQVNQMYGVVVRSEFNFQSPVWETLLRIAQPIEGVIFVHDSFVDCDGRILFGYLADLGRELKSDGAP